MKLFKEDDLEITWNLSLTSIIKGMAIIMIVFGHAGNRIPGSRILTPLGAIGVGLFLICSGFGLEKSFQTNGLRRYWFKKFINVWIPYFIIELIGLFFHPDISFGAFLADILFIIPRHPFGWYMQFLFLWYIVFYIASIIEDYVRVKGMKLLVLSITAVAVITLWDSLHAENALSFLIGVYLATQSNLNKFCSWRVIVPLAITAIPLIAIRGIRLLNSFQGGGIIWNVYSLLYYTILTLIVTCIILRIDDNLRIMKLFYYIGGYSYSIYLVHGYAFISFTDSSPLAVLLFFACTIVGSILFDLLIRSINRIFCLK